jgi:hypothetical protein
MSGTAAAGSSLSALEPPNLALSALYLVLRRSYVVSVGDGDVHRVRAVDVPEDDIRSAIDKIFVLTRQEHQAFMMAQREKEAAIAASTDELRRRALAGTISGPEGLSPD